MSRWMRATALKSNDCSGTRFDGRSDTLCEGTSGMHSAYEMPSKEFNWASDVTESRKVERRLTFNMR